jgi:hypothetical protein
MINPENCIYYLTNACKKSISKTFNLSLKNASNNLRHYIIDGTSSGLNRFDVPQESVKVLNWFDNFWLYFEIRFIAENKKQGNKVYQQTNINISLSVFQGEDDDNEKYQLFRAEWDDHNNPEEVHAQPHWHITSSQAIERTFLRYSDTFEKQDFVDLLESERKKIFDVKKMHFAMNGDWQSKRECIHRITEEEQITNWLLGLLIHLRTELSQ